MIISMCNQLRPLAFDVDMEPYELQAYRGHLRAIRRSKKAHTIETVGKLHLLFQVFDKEYVPPVPFKGKQKTKQGNKAYYMKGMY